MQEIADIFVLAVKNHESSEELQKLKNRVLSLCEEFPLYT